MTTVPPVRGMVKEEGMEEEEEEEVMETQLRCPPPPHLQPDSDHLSAAQIFSPSKVALLVHSSTHWPCPLSLPELQGVVTPSTATGQIAPPSASPTHGGGRQCFQTGHGE